MADSDHICDECSWSSDKALRLACGRSKPATRGDIDDLKALTIHTLTLVIDLTLEKYRKEEKQ